MTFENWFDNQFQDGAEVELFETAPTLLSIAPMMDRTDRHYRYLMRLISQRTLLYTEMVTTGAIIFGDRDFHLGFNSKEHPIALQLGGANIDDLAKCAHIAVSDYGYDEINLNVGCPSNRVQNGDFGACLMAKPEHVRDCVIAMKEAVGASIPVTVKHRIGIDEHRDYAFMKNFVETVALGGCRRFSVHARVAILQGLDPKQNRDIPPLRYDEVFRLKQERPDLYIELNGGIKSLVDAKSHLEKCDAVMIGRAAYDTPWLFSKVDALIAHESKIATPPHINSRADVVTQMASYLRQHMEKQGARPVHVLRHMLNLYHGVSGARAWRRFLTTESAAIGKDPDTLIQFIEQK